MSNTTQPQFLEISMDFANSDAAGVLFQWSGEAKKSARPIKLSDLAAMLGDPEFVVVSGHIEISGPDRARIAVSAQRVV